METKRTPFESTDPRLPRLSGTLLRFCGKLSDVNHDFRLIPSSPDKRVDDLTEFYSQQLESHIVMFSSASNVGKAHYQLKDKGVKLFPEISAEDRVLLIIPEGTRTLRNMLHLVARNVESYGSIFDQLGAGVRSLFDAGYGLPADGSVLDQFAVAIEEESREGSGVYFCPPYELSTERTPEAIMNQIVEEITQAGVLNERGIEYSIGRIQDGWNTIG